MPIKLEPDWGRARKGNKGMEAARDIILNCRTRKDDAIYAKKWKMTKDAVCNIRCGTKWKELRRQLTREGLI